ncbi:MAG: SDR family oxidoreductase [Myxococcales bacterium]|nr:SDR family oxidoreductase [Myxococcales bacterium]
MTISVIAGSSQGIGLELVRQLAARGETVVAVCRGEMPEVPGDVRVETGLDFTTEGVMERLAARLTGLEVGLLVVNAGLLVPDTFDTFDVAQLRAQLEINAIAPLLLVRALRPNLKRGSKVALVTSRMGSMADNTSAGYYGYRMSKAALNMAGTCLAVDLKPAGIAVGLLHPGYVRTRMVGWHGEIDVGQAALGIIGHIDRLDLTNTGGFWHASKAMRLPF